MYDKKYLRAESENNLNEKQLQRRQMDSYAMKQTKIFTSINDDPDLKRPGVLFSNQMSEAFGKDCVQVIVKRTK